MSLPRTSLPSRPVDALLSAARHGLAAATVAGTPGERYAQAHLAALRAGAALLAARARPAGAGSGPRQTRPRLASLWSLLVVVAPELTEWSRFFAAGAAKRAAAESGLPYAVTAREADDLLRDSGTFLALVETTLGVPHQPSFDPGADGGSVRRSADRYDEVRGR